MPCAALSLYIYLLWRWNSQTARRAFYVLTYRYWDGLGIECREQNCGLGLALFGLKGQPAYEISALNVDFNGVRCDPLGSKSSPYERVKFGYPIENVRFLLLSTNLAREWLQIDTDLLRIITSTADELSGCTNIDDLERPWTPKIWVLSEFFAILGCDAHLEWIFAEIYWR